MASLSSASCEPATRRSTGRSSPSMTRTLHRRRSTSTPRRASIWRDAPPWSARLIRSPDRTFLSITWHHVLVDAPSVRLVLDEIAAHYTGSFDADVVTQFGGIRRHRARASRNPAIPLAARILAGRTCGRAAGALRSPHSGCVRPNSSSPEVR